MEIKILKESKEEVEFEISNLTIAEILRVYLNKNPEVSFAAWKRDHPTKNPVMLVKTKGKSAKKAIEDAISDLVKDLEKVEKDFGKFKF